VQERLLGLLRVLGVLPLDPAVGDDQPPVASRRTSGFQALDDAILSWRA
jgi:hypothetical protein